MPDKITSLSPDLPDSNDWIPGIYNYCDRWCERCSFTSRCRSFAMEIRTFDPEPTAEDPASGPEPDIRSKKFWEDLGVTMNKTLEYLHSLSSGDDLPAAAMNDQQWEDRKKRDEELEQEAGEHPLALAAWNYSDMVEAWMSEHKTLLDDKFAELETRIQLDASAKRAATETDLIKDAIEIIRWYEPQIWVKLMRAITGQISEARLAPQAGVQADSDGSAKVALIGIDRSLAAWGQLHFMFPEYINDFINVLLQLDRLRKQAEQVFPAARAFRRAGFDDLPDEMV